MKQIFIKLYHCKGIRLLCLLLLCILLAPAQTTQAGYAKTKGRMDSKGNLIPGTRIGGVAIQLTGGHSTVADANGNFTLTAPDRKFYLSNVQKQGYVLTDPDMLKKQYVCSSNPLVISMETKEKLADDQLAAERKLRRQLQKQLQQKEDEIDALKEENKITEEEYRQALQKLYAEQESNEKLVSDMAKRYAELDYDLLDEFYRQVSFCIENGDLVKADSLLLSRGDVSQQIKDAQKKAQAFNEEKEKLQQAEAVLAADIDELGRRCYSFYEKFASQYKNDSAAYYLELRANLDTTNIGWQLETGEFIQEYLADYNKGLTYYQRALRQALAQYGENHRDVAYSYNYIGSVYHALGEYEHAMDYFQKALSIQQAILEKNHPDLVSTYNHIGSVYGALGDFSHALEYYHKCLDIRRTLYGENNPEVANSYTNIGYTLYESRDFEHAMEYHQKALSILKSVYGENHPEVAISYNNIGLVYEIMDDYAQALEYHQKALNIRKSIYGENHPNVAINLNNVGSVYIALKEYTQALEYFQKSLSIWKAFYGENHPQVALSYNNIGWLYVNQGKYSTALECYQKSLSIWKSVYGEKHPDVAMCYNNIGELYTNQGDYAHALEYRQKALDIMVSLYGESHPEVGLCYYFIGNVYENQGNYDSATEYYQKSMAINEQVYGKDHLYTKITAGRIETVSKKKTAQDPVAMKQYVFTAAFEANENQELSGEYVVLKFDNWTIDDTKSLYDVRKEMKGKPTTVLLMKGNGLAQHTFDKGIDVPIDLKKVGKKEKTRIVGWFHQYVK